MKKDDWVASLKVGDEVAVRDRWNRTYNIYKVCAITPSGRVRVPISERATWEFNPNGWLRGADQWSQTMIEPVTPRVHEVNRRCVIYELLSKAEWRRLDLATLEQIVAMLPPAASGAGEKEKP